MDAIQSANAAGAAADLCDVSTLHYSMVLEWDQHDQIFVVTVPELPGCRTHGTTYEEAMRQGLDAIGSWVDAAREDGDTLPPPHYWSPPR